MTRILNILLTVIAVVALWVAIHQYQRANAAMAALAKMHREQSKVPPPDVAADSKPPVEPRPRAVHEPASDASASAEQQRAIARVKMAQAMEDASTQRELRATAAMQQLDFEHMRASLPAHFAPLYSDLRMSEEDIRQFESILTEKYRANREIEAARDFENRGSPDAPEHLALLSQAAAPFDERIRGLLGDAGFEKYQRQENTAGVRPMLQSFIGLSALSAVPLTPQQADLVAEVLNASLDLTLNRNVNVRWVSPRNWTDLQARGTSYDLNLGWSDIDMEAALPQLQAVLTQKQMDSLRSLHQQEFTRKRAGDIYRRTVREQQLERQRRARESIAPAAAPDR